MFNPQYNQSNTLQYGQRVTISCQNKYIGKIKDRRHHLAMADVSDSYEVFIVESDGIQHAFKQQVSNLYIGGDVKEERTPFLVEKRDSCEQMFLQTLQNGYFKIRSVKNTYLCLVGDTLQWRSSPSNQQSIWKITVLSQMVSSTGSNSSSIIPLGVTITIYNKYGLIGKNRGLREKLELTNQSGFWEQFIPQRANGNKISFKQVASGYYIGHTAEEGQSPCLAACWQQYQFLDVQDKGSGKFALKNCKGCYLAFKNGKSLVWKRYLDDTGIWSFKVVHDWASFPIFPKGALRVTQSVNR